MPPLAVLLDVDGVLINVTGDDAFLFPTSSLSTITSVEWQALALEFYASHAVLLPNIELLFSALGEWQDRGCIEVLLWTHSVGPRALVIGHWICAMYFGGRRLPVIHRDSGAWSTHSPVPRRWDTSEGGRVGRHYVKSVTDIEAQHVQWLDHIGTVHTAVLSVDPCLCIQVDDTPDCLRRSRNSILVPSLVADGDCPSVALSLVHLVKVLIEDLQRCRHTGGCACLISALRGSSLLSSKLFCHFESTACRTNSCSDSCGSGAPEFVSGFCTELFSVFTLNHLGLT